MHVNVKKEVEKEEAEKIKEEAEEIKEEEVEEIKKLQIVRKLIGVNQVKEKHLMELNVLSMPEVVKKEEEEEAEEIKEEAEKEKEIELAEEIKEEEAEEIKKLQIVRKLIGLNQVKEKHLMELNVLLMLEVVKKEEEEVAEKIKEEVEEIKEEEEKEKEIKMQLKEKPKEKLNLGAKKMVIMKKMKL